MSPPHVGVRIGKRVNRQKAWLTGKIPRIPFRRMGGEAKIVGGVGLEAFKLDLMSLGKLDGGN